MTHGRFRMRGVVRCLRRSLLFCVKLFGVCAFATILKQIHASNAERERSRALSTFRVQIEHSFNDVKKYFKKLQFGKNLRWGQNLLEPTIILSILLSNCRICLEGGCLTSDRFNVIVPSLDEYLSYSHDRHTLDLINPSCDSIVFRLFLRRAAPSARIRSRCDRRV
jgi:hypothetical protein